MVQKVRMTLMIWFNWFNHMWLVFLNFLLLIKKYQAFFKKKIYTVKNKL